MLILEIFMVLALWVAKLIQPVIVPLCFILTWTFIASAIFGSWSTVRSGINNVKRLHQIPCANCEFFTGDYHLKCAVRPDIALSEAAIECRDYEPLR